jgi:hypothetical protein
MRMINAPLQIVKGLISIKLNVRDENHTFGGMENTFFSLLFYKSFFAKSHLISWHTFTERT